MKSPGIMITSERSEGKRDNVMLSSLNTSDLSDTREGEPHLGSNIHYWNSVIPLLEFFHRMPLSTASSQTWTSSSRPKCQLPQEHLVSI